MASGQSLMAFESTDYTPVVPSVHAPHGSATPDMRNFQPVLDFDPTAPEVADFAGRMPRHYGGGGITLSIMWTATAAVTGYVIWTAAFERHDPATDLDGDSFGPWVFGPQVVTNAVLGAPAYTELALSPAALDGILPGEHFRLRVARALETTMPGDAELWSVELRET